MKITIDIPDSISEKALAAFAKEIREKARGIARKNGMLVDEKKLEVSNLELIQDYFRSNIILSFEDEIKQEAVQNARKLY
jgi:hypothetical protein